MPGRVFSNLVGRRSSHHSSASIDGDRVAGVNGAMQTWKDLRRRSMERPRSARSQDSSNPSSRKNSPKPGPAARLAMNMESPPLVLYGPPSSSTGALLSGQLYLHIEESEMRIERFELILNIFITAFKPITVHCPECTVQTTQLTKWDFLKEPATFKRGQHAFPFSFLIPGHLPASVQTPFGEIEYAFSANATTTKGENIPLQRRVSVQRAILPGNEKTSMRLFPPTNITAHVNMTPVIHPIGDFTIYFRLAGMVKKEQRSQTRWRLRRAQWRIEEVYEMISPACSKHSYKVGGDGKGVRHHDARTIGHGEYRNGWKGNPNDNNGDVEMEFQAAIKPGKDAVCNVQATSGLWVSHKLIIEMVVAEEWCPNNDLKSITASGSARILRMQFDLIVTQRSGLGISWDEEQPPMYEDVPGSPPTYTQMEELRADQLGLDEDIEHLEITS